jgi:hypothetical protein
MPMQHTGNVYMLLSSTEKIQKSFYDESVEIHEVLSFQVNLMLVAIEL